MLLDDVGKSFSINSSPGFGWIGSAEDFTLP
jgi:hypothetical protein